ncbi:MAG: inositol-3-phosphate synthase [Bacteroidota bacterium]
MDVRPFPPDPSSSPSRRLGLAIVGVGGAVSTTAAAGVELLRQGRTEPHGLPLASLDTDLICDLAPYGDLVIGGWDVSGDDLAAAARGHDVLSLQQYGAAEDALAAVTPWPAVGDERFCRGVTGAHVANCDSPSVAVDAVRADLRRFRDDEGLDGVVMINLASTEATPERDAALFQSADAFEAAVEAGDDRIPPAMLYAYAAILEGVPYGNFTPSTGADVPALIELAERHGVPLAGKDGKTGQTFVKTLVAPGLRARALGVEGWFSTNILGNRDGEALREADSLASKIGTKGSVLDQILGYEVEDHVVKINYYRPRGDAKEAWDNVDLVGFLGEQMQLKINFLCKDSILAAPLVIEIARLLDAAQRDGEGGVMEWMGTFFKGPMTADGREPEHALHEQQAALLGWLEARAARRAPSEGDGAALAAVPTVEPSAS